MMFRTVVIIAPPVAQHLGVAFLNCLVASIGRRVAVL
jgi:hypothetical protein